jgi:hypothetical protein
MSVVASTPAAIAAALGLNNAFSASTRHDDDLDVDVDPGIGRGPDHEH